jgi:hypothetical protein
VTRDTSTPTASGLNELELLNLDPVTKEAPETRLKDVKSAIAIYNTLRRADEGSSTARSRMDAMFDGIPPHDPKVLNSTGQGSRTNLNFGEAQRYLDVSMSAFVDLYSSLETLVRVSVTGGEPTQRSEAGEVIAEELTNTLRAQPEFHSNYLRLCTEFTKHGVGVSYFDDPTNWRFRVCGLGDFLIPRQTQASEEAIEVAVARRQYLLHELYGFIRNPEAATKLGWNADEVKRVIVANARTSGNTGSGGTFSEWETTQREMKNNDIYTGIENTSVRVLHLWAREFDGSVSYFVFAEDNPKEFMFKSTSMFPAPEQAYVLFSYGVGTNGTYHSVRGLGHRIFNHVQVGNRLRSQQIDSAMMAGSVMIQPESQRALEDLSFTMYGPYSILSPNVRVIEKGVPNLSQSMTPAINDLQQQLSMNVDLMSTYGNQSSPYRNQLQTEHDLAVASRLTGSTINLFYASWSRLLREVVRRIITAKPNSGDRAIRDFYARCAARSVTPDMIKTVDPNKTIAVRAIGAGSQANRLLALRELRQMSGEFDEVGRRKLTRMTVATRVGYDLADEFAPANPEPRTTVDAKIAVLENDALQAGRPVAVLDSELHSMHLRMHVPIMQEALAGIESGTVDPATGVPMLQAFSQHVGEHANYLAGDQSAAADVASVRQLLQMAEMVIVNFNRKLQAEQRRAAESGQQQAEGGQPQPDPKAGQAELNLRLKMEEHELRMQIARQKAELEAAIKQAKADQELALKDAERALKMRGFTTS